MKIPLPIDTQLILKNINMLSKTSNLGLLFNKYVYSWQDSWEMKEENSKMVRQFIADRTFTKEHIDNLIKRQKAMLQSLKSSNWHVAFFEATTDSRLIIGLGSTSVIQTGMTLHHLYGFPYLPASGLKGLARAYAEIAEDFQDEETKRQFLLNIFGSEDKNPRHAANNRQGKVFFMDGLPVAFPKLELDIMNPHYSEYYQGNKPPADYLNPVPVTFLAVAPDQKFTFALYSKDADLLNKAKQWLTAGLTDFGAGGKTNVGYGYFKDFIDLVLEKPSVSFNQLVNKSTDIQERIKLIKNPQTFTEFIKGIKEDEIETLKGISFKGKESVINIGLTEALESAEVSSEVKKIIAQKIFEICKEPEKKHTEKLEKYKKLKLMAGVE